MRRSLSFRRRRIADWTPGPAPRAAVVGGLTVHPRARPRQLPVRHGRRTSAKDDVQIAAIPYRESPVVGRITLRAAVAVPVVGRQHIAWHGQQSARYAVPPAGLSGGPVGPRAAAPSAAVGLHAALLGTGAAGQKQGALPASAAA